MVRARETERRIDWRAQANNGKENGGGWGGLEEKLSAANRSCKWGR